ncbi:hypothetical protein DFA_12160 [Cavenderia fasciculata]|uniref:Uncharacterized protein n=1 Tax=Cavenderia fasciculata TaxID=261658 RepID=F4QCA7_CACFS|nr:uncharacterized protein DFA_12160 [Cavenderia fasciculata]EGG14388.1 hypothetical protein DFA_12160 [Cavenderia fasciculata]|eukprot:XP_004353797.1 hypothetical protein DFA_12160 [Cavenderia fasciculata]
MGGIISKYNGTDEYNVLFVGLDGSGKSSILYHFLGLGKDTTKIPVLCSFTESVSYKNIQFTSYDLGGDKGPFGQDDLFQKTSAIVFVLDASDPLRLDQSRIELTKLLNNEHLQTASEIVLILANKMDRPDAMTIDQIRTILLDHPSIVDCAIKPTIGNNPEIGKDGFIDAMNWLINKLENKS